MTEQFLTEIRADIARIEGKVDSLRDHGFRIHSVEQDVQRLRGLVEGGPDGRSGLIFQFTKIEQQMHAILWTVRTLGTATLVTLVGILVKVVASTGVV